MTKTPAISVVVPFHNEEDSLPELVASLYSELRKTGRSFEVILVDDGSGDSSLAAAQALLAEHPGLTLVSLRRNYGKSAALAVGLERARGQTILTIDADLQNDPADIPGLLEALDGGLDLVCGWRRPRRDSIYKRLQSRLYNLALTFAGFRVVHDINCPFKAMRREVAAGLPLYAGRHRLIPLIATWLGFRVGEVVVNHRPRRHGRSKYGASRFPGALFDILTALLLSRLYRRSSHLFSTIGALLLLAGLAICGYITYLKIATGSTHGRYPLLILGVLLLVIGVQYVLTGFLSELVFHSRGNASARYSVGKIVTSQAPQERPPAGE